VPWTHTKAEYRRQNTENRAQKTEKSDIRFLTSDICLLVLCLPSTTFVGLCITSFLGFPNATRRVWGPLQKPNMSCQLKCKKLHSAAQSPHHNPVPRTKTAPLPKNYKDSTGLRSKIRTDPPIRLPLRLRSGLRLIQGRLYADTRFINLNLYQISRSPVKENLHCSVAGQLMVVIPAPAFAGYVFSQGKTIPIPKG